MVRWCTCGQFWGYPCSDESVSVVSLGVPVASLGVPVVSCRGTCAQLWEYLCSGTGVLVFSCTPVVSCGGTCCQVGVSGAEEGSQCCSDIHTTDKGTLHSQRRSWCDLEDVADVSAPSTAQLQSI